MSVKAFIELKTQSEHRLKMASQISSKLHAMNGYRCEEGCESTEICESNMIRDSINILIYNVEIGDFAKRI